jgi:L-fuconate dehydratase
VANLERALAEGWSAFKIKVGSDLAEDRRRLALLRDRFGAQVRVALDANQVWGVDQAVAWLAELEPFGPWWIEEPTSPDDVAGHARIHQASGIPVATGEHVHNRVMFKQFLEAGAMQVCQVDPCRVAGVSEAVVVLLLAAAAGIPVCPHTGGIGLLELGQHLAVLDALRIGRRLDDPGIEFAGTGYYGWFAERPDVRGGRLFPPRAAGAVALAERFAPPRPEDR